MAASRETPQHDTPVTSPSIHPPITAPTTARTRAPLAPRVPPPPRWREPGRARFSLRRGALPPRSVASASTFPGSRAVPSCLGSQGKKETTSLSGPTAFTIGPTQPNRLQSPVYNPPPTPSPLPTSNSNSNSPSFPQASQPRHPPMRSPPTDQRRR
ncbi:hypothetical protein ZWY2020_011730 [Hordeum vulgare]|nr:hypothetical protein ZWY2020_011730 [Hordeum vulgare]